MTRRDIMAGLRRAIRARRVQLATLAIAANTATTAAHAQAIRGVVSDSITRQPVPAVVVILDDSTGTQITRTITGLDGAFRVQARAASTTTLRFLRIGYRPRAEHVVARNDSVVESDVSLLRLPSVLVPIVSVANARCPRRADNEDALAMWQQAQLGLLASAVAGEESRARIVAYRYHRDLSGSRVESQTVSRIVGTWSKAFGAARAARDFVHGGFVGIDSGRRTFFGPDAEVLLDTAFQSHYCFQLAGAPHRPHDVGLQFAPATRDRGRVDIEGALWIDTTRWTLRDLDFRFVTAQRRPVGEGHMQFTPMPTGQTQIEFWWLRHRELGPMAVEDGAVLATAEWPDGPRWAAVLGVLRVHATDDHGAPARVRVALDSTDYEAQTDSSGDAEIRDVLPGPYRVTVSDAVLTPLGFQIAKPVQIVVADSSPHRIDVTVMTPVDLAQRVCGAARAAPANDPVAVVVRAVGEDGTPRRVRWSVAAESGTTDGDGRLELCVAGQPGGPPLELSFACPKCGTIKLPLRPVLTAALVRLP